MTELCVVKHMADRVANEPRNVGVIARARRRRPQDFYLDHVLTILDGDDVELIADEYFSRLVQTAGRVRAPADRVESGSPRRRTDMDHSQPTAARRPAGRRRPRR